MLVSKQGTQTGLQASKHIRGFQIAAQNTHCKQKQTRPRLTLPFPPHPARRIVRRKGTRRFKFLFMQAPIGQVRRLRETYRMVLQIPWLYKYEFIPV